MRNARRMCGSSSITNTLVIGHQSVAAVRPSLTTTRGPPPAYSPPESHAGGVVVIPQPLEGFEELILPAVGDSRAFVDDVDQDAIADPPRVDPDHAVGRVAQRIVD